MTASVVNRAGAVLARGAEKPSLNIENIPINSVGAARHQNAKVADVFFGRIVHFAAVMLNGS
jgi:hypothetical protein